ncbi:MAG: alpha/beta fold hydrolase [Gemmataceae bacterium]|nr:alpha/beta fold hydrolase [Gemmataceae bacterium]
MTFLDLKAPLSRPAEGFYTSLVDAPRPWPVRTFLPQGYEPRYPYPLLVLLHGHGGNEEQMLRLAPRLSRRNFICISLRGPISLGIKHDELCWSWGDASQLPLVESYVVRAAEQTRRKYHVHSERIYLAGHDEGAALAYRLAWTLPEKFAGVIALNGAIPRSQRPLMPWPAVRGQRVFIGHGIANSVVPLSLAQADWRLLYAAGVDVTMRTYPTTHRLHEHMLRDVNRWIVDHCNRDC